MNTIKYFGLIAIVGLLSCGDILDKEPIATLDAGSFFQTYEDAIQATNAAYKPLLFNNDNSNFYWAFSALCSDEAITGGDGSRPGLVELEAFSYTPRTEEFNSFWKLQYKGITQCNLVLDNLEKITMTDVQKNTIKGEALFLRSYYYFLLTQVFGDVPLYLKIVSPEELKIAKTNKLFILDQIVKDCQIAGDLLPITRSTNELGRATKGAAYALAAKASLYSKKYDDVINYVSKIKVLNVYGLMEDYNDNFTKEKQNNKESVWEIQHTNLQLGVGNFLNQWWLSKKLMGYGFAEVNQSFVDAFEVGDPRRQYTLASNNEPYLGVVYKNSFSSTKFSPRKYLQTPGTVTQVADGDINYTAIRYADVLLWEAEAYNELNKVAEAGAVLEVVRARARAQSQNPNTVLPKIVTTNQLEMRLAIQHEREVELGFEIHRFFDLVRWGIAADVMPDFVREKHEVFPLPQTELDLNGALVQNKGY
jgi:starch-binding outer membrane protein, SusD/RagB family